MAQIEDMKLRRVQKASLVAHNSQNPQNQKTLELGIVVKRVVHAFVVLFMLSCCCSPVVQQGCYPFAYSFVVKACQIKQSQRFLHS